MMKLNVREITVYGMLGALMYVSKIVMEVLPNVHLIGVFTIALTVVYRSKALFPIYIFVFLTGIYAGFAGWWIPYLYVWAVLWGIIMLLPQNMPPAVRPIVYMIICGLHGMGYGTLYAPVQALMFGFDFQGMVAWIVAGFPWDVVHGIGNLVCGILIVQIISALRLAERITHPK